jgi:beta-glucosidase-like glycosyl hydrolase
VQVNFAPVADVNINPQNPVINVRSFGENPLLVADKVIAYASGLESGRVLSVAKHFPGHGDTDVDSHKALPVLPFTRERLDSVELYPFRKLIHAGLGGVMVGHLQVPVFEPVGKLPSSLSRNVVYTLLTEKMAFKGLIFTDALAMKGVSSAQKVCLQALKAGNDVVLAPRDVKKEIDYVVEAVKKGEFSEEEIDERCRKVLLFKYAMGLNRKPVVRLSGLERRINTPHTRDLIRRLNLAAVTVLNNEKGVLPIHPDVKQVAVLTVGKAKELEAFTNELKKYVEVHTFELGKQMPDSLQQKLRDSLSAYVVSLFRLTKSVWRPISHSLLNSPSSSGGLRFLYSGQTDVANTSGHIQCLFRCVGDTDSDEVQEQIAALLFGKAAANGRLSAGIGGLFRAGAGLTVTTSTPYHFVPEEYGMRSEVLQSIDTIAMRGIHAGAYPGCQIVVLKNGRTMYNKSFGTFTYEDEKAVSTNDIYDLASLSKTTGTLLAVMKLYDNGRFNLSDPIGDYLLSLKERIKLKSLSASCCCINRDCRRAWCFIRMPLIRRATKGASLKDQKTRCIWCR